jgi:hypothetical protein
MKTTIRPMQKIMLVLITLFVMTNITAQQENGKKNKETKVKDIAVVKETHSKTHVSFPGGTLEVMKTPSDTITKITLGQRRYEILDESTEGITRIRMVHAPRDYFKGHWAGVDLGLTNFFSAPFDSELPEENIFMDLNTTKSISISINFLQYNIDLRKRSNNFGLVTGMGITFNNYRLDSQYALTRDENGHTSYVETERLIKKNKLATTFLTVPLLLELQVPTQKNASFFISGGLYSAFKLGSHTKLVYNDNLGNEKEKSRSDLNVNSFKYGATIRGGYRFVKLYANYDLSQLFQAGQGPELYPWTVGLTLINF